MYKTKNKYSTPTTQVLQFATSLMKDWDYSAAPEPGNFPGGAPARVPARKLYL